MNARTPRVVLSPCGTSLLTNGCTDDERRLLGRHSNSFRLEDLGDDQAAVEARVDSVAALLETADAATARRVSAELNGLLTLCDEQPAHPADHLILLCTDTWLGERTGQIVQGWLHRNGHLSVELRRQVDLQTRDLHKFQISLSNLVRWWGEAVDEYRRRQYRILFNLTGGFKSVQGFLQTLGNLYADETVYIFETSRALLRVPRLPIRLDMLDAVRQHQYVIRRLDAALPVAAADLADVPETFLERDGADVLLSPWGTIVWDQSRKTLYAEGVLPPPTDRVRFAETFLPSTKSLSPDRYANLNDKLDKLATFLEGDQVRPVRSLDLKPLRNNPKPPSTHEFDAWADRDAKRVFCRYEGDVLVLDRLDDALHRG